MMFRGDYQYILDNREKRAHVIQRSLDSTGGTLVEVTLNIPGKEKDSLLYRAVHMEMLTRLLPVMKAHLVYLEYLPEGPFALLNTALSPLWVKNIAVGLEEDTPEGRIFDIDVFHPDGTKVGRSGPLRSCYLCDDSASVCARLQRHTQEQLQLNIHQRIQASPYRTRINRLTETLSMDRYHAVPHSLASDRASTISRLAQQALVQEVALTPKPGLVDGYDTGSHTDMDLQTFLCSATALGETFFRLARASMAFEDSDLSALLPVLRQIGIDGEKAMFDATGGVNTHKGMIFSCGLITAAASLNSQLDSLPNTIAHLCSHLVSHDLENLQVPMTYGEELFVTFHIRGIRGEAETGFPSVFRMYRRFRLLCEHYDRRSSLLQVLMEIMSTLEDTNILGRGGRDALEWVQRQSSDYLSRGGVTEDQNMKCLYDLNEKFKERNLSPGGSADTLGCIIFLDLLVKEGLLH